MHDFMRDLIVVLCIQTFYALMTNFKSMLNMFTKQPSASSQDELSGQKQRTSPVGDGDTPPSDKVPDPSVERKLENQTEPLEDLDMLNVFHACDLVEIEWRSPSFGKDYADAVNPDDFPDENAAELVLAGILAEDKCAQLGLSLRETLIVKCRIKMMYLEAIRLFESDAANTAEMEKSEPEPETEAKKPNWLLRLKAKSKCSFKARSSKDSVNESACKQGEATSDERVGKSSAQRFKGKITRIRGRIMNVRSLLKKSERKCKLSLSSTGRSGKAVGQSSKATHEDNDRGNHFSTRANGRRRGNTMTFNWRKLWSEKANDELWWYHHELLGTAKLNYPGSKVFDAVRRGDLLRVVAHDKGGSLLLVNSPCRDMLSLVPAHIVELADARDTTLDVTLKHFKIPNRLDYWLKTPPGLGDVPEDSGAGVAHTQAKSSRYGFKEKCQTFSEKLFSRKSVKKREADLSKKHEFKSKLNRRATWIKLWKSSKDTVNKMDNVLQKAGTVLVDKNIKSDG